MPAPFITASPLPASWLLEQPSSANQSCHTIWALYQHNAQSRRHGSVRTNWRQLQHNNLHALTACMHVLTLLVIYKKSGHKSKDPIRLPKMQPALALPKLSASHNGSLMQVFPNLHPGNSMLHTICITTGYQKPGSALAVHALAIGHSGLSIPIH